MGAVVAVDANGADLGPSEVAAGALLAAEQGVKILLFGPSEQLYGLPSTIEVRDAPVSIAKSADPVSAVRAHPEASIVQAAKAVGSGEADALLCAGGTGAALAAGLFNIKRGKGIHRPALALPLPLPSGDLTLLDVGANADARREHLVQFAFMGAAFAQTVLRIERPRVALLSNGKERERGSALLIEAHSELSERAAEATFLFIGNVEGGDLFEDAADVVVTDGFTGNIALKLIEGASAAMLAGVRTAALSSRRARIGGAMMMPALRSLREEVDPERQGGAYLLGLRSLGVIPHGRFTARGFAEAMMRAARGAEESIAVRTWEALAAAGALRGGQEAACGAGEGPGAEGGGKAGRASGMDASLRSR